MKLLPLTLCVGALLVAAPARADDCPAGTDPVYCKIAKETGGKVVTDIDDLKDIPAPEPVFKAPVRHNSMFSRELGCEYQALADQPLCKLIESKEEWSWLGHGGPFPGWRVTFKTICQVYYKYEITQDHLPQLERMRKVNFGDIDWRLQFGLDGLIRVLKNKDGATPEDAGSIYDPANATYILKSCRS